MRTKSQVSGTVGMGCAQSTNTAGDWNVQYEKNVHSNVQHHRETTRASRKAEKSKGQKHTVKKSTKDNSLEMVNDYSLGKKLGKGAFGEVLLAKKGERKYAMKVLKKSALKRMRTGKTGSALDSIKTEIATMKKIQHPNCVHMYDVILDPGSDEIFLVLEFVDGGVSQVVGKDEKPIPVKERVIWSHLVRKRWGSESTLPSPAHHLRRCAPVMPF